jgi:hypothetical protein
MKQPGPCSALMLVTGLLSPEEHDSDPEAAEEASWNVIRGPTPSVGPLVKIRDAYGMIEGDGRILTPQEADSQEYLNECRCISATNKEIHLVVDVFDEIGMLVMDVADRIIYTYATEGEGQELRDQYLRGLAIAAVSVLGHKVDEGN